MMYLDEAILEVVALSGRNMEVAELDRLCTSWINEMQELGIDLEVAAQAYKAVSRKSEYLPTVKGVLEMIHGSDDAKALDAWVKVTDVAQILNAIYRPTIFDDPQIHYTITAMGGWKELYNQITALRHIGESLQWIKKDFIASYKACRTGKYKMLIAYGDGKGQKPIVIGNRDECKRLLTVAKDKQLNNANETIKRLAQGKGTE